MWKALPPPLTSVEMALDYAGSALDRSVPLFDRWNLVSTAVRLAVAVAVSPGKIVKDSLMGENAVRRLEASGLCDVFRSLINYDVCSGGNADGDRWVRDDSAGPVLRRLAALVYSVDNGEIPVTGRLVEFLAQAVIVLLAPALDELRSRGYREMMEL